MTDITKYRNMSLTHDVYTAGHLLTKEITPGIELSMAQLAELLIMEKIKDMKLEDQLASYKRPQIKKQSKQKKKGKGHV
tara:strand:+ start:85 stop:321 length:237 start_codon:yes stop_codon:yes gene_type:complete